MDQIVHYFNELMQLLNWAAVHIPWEAVFGAFTLSGILIGPQKAVKRWFKHNEAVIISIIAVVGPTAMAAWTYLLHHYGTDPSLVVLQGLALSFGTQPFYFMVWKPYVLGRLVPKLAKWVAAQVSEANLLNEAKTALEPAGGLPTAAAAAESPKVSVPIQDFKP